MGVQTDERAGTDGAEPIGPPAAPAAVEVPARTSSAAVPEAWRGLGDKISRNSSSIGAQVYDVLREAVLSGTFVPGVPLRQEALAAALGVSRVPIRSGLMQLEAEGLIELSDRGAMVASLTVAQVQELYQIRAVLEAYAIRRSLRSMTPARAARLRRVSAEVDARSTREIDARADFYRELYDADRNPELVTMLEELRLRVGRYLFAWRRTHDRAAAHRRLLEAVMSGDEQLAVRVVHEGLAEARNAVLVAVTEEQAQRSRVRRRQEPRRQG